FPLTDMRGNEYSDSRPNYSSQNLYVQPPTRGGSEPTRSGGPQMYPGGHETPESKNNLMRGSGPDPRFVSFKKEGSVGIRLAGGNEVGIYVTAVQPGSQAQLQGLIPGDKILKVNDMDMSGVTREEAVLYLMSLQDQIDLIVQTCIQDYDHILNNTKGDLFYIKTHFHYEPNGKNELSFRSGDIFRVVDTLHNGVVGAWQVHRIGRNNQETQKGTVPNKARAEELATAQFNAAKKEQTQSESRGGFFKRRRNSRRSKSLGKDHWEDVVFADSVSKFPAYERVTLRNPGFVRPIVLFGPLADIARDNLLKENPAKFASPRVYMRLTMPIPAYGYHYPHLRELDSHGEKASGIIRLSAIREIMERGKHAVLDITPNAVDRLNYAQFYPVVIFLRAESKQIVKELRSGYPKGRMNSKKLFDQSVKLEKLWSHVFTATVSLTQPDTWYRKVREIVDKQQTGPLWMSETKPTEALSDDFLFPMTSRLSYASSPESDMETGPESRTPSKSPHRPPPSYLSNSEARGEPRSRMVKSSSDPSLAAPEEISDLPSHAPPGHGGPPPYTASPTRMPPPQGGTSDGFDDRRKSHGGDSKYGFASSNPYGNDQYSSRPPGGHPQHPGMPPPGGGSGPPQPGTLPYGSPPQGYHNSRHQQPQQQTKQNIPPPTHSPNQRRSPNALPGRPPQQLGQSPSGGHMQPPPPYVNGHNGDAPPPEVPPKIDRGSKPSQRRQTPQDGGGPHGGKEGDYDANYINTGRASSLERQQKSPYDMMNPSLGPNAHDDLKSRLHPRSPQDHYRYNRSTSQPPIYRSDDPYRSSDYKPLPPPKSNNYKPVPPPKPRNYKQQTPDSGMGGWGMYESRKNYDRTSYHTNNNGGLSDDYSGLDSGQGSSLDRKYDTFGRSSYGKMGTGGAGRTGYYLNVPPPRDMNNQGSHSGGGPGGRDLPNHDHRGSAFELYKKPPDPRGGPPGPPIPQYTDIGNSGQRGRLGEDAASKHKVIATARGVFDHAGGTLSSEETGVSIVIPPGAIAKGTPQEIYFKVCQDRSLVPPLDQDKGETLLSPLVMCGPHGLAFKRPVELRLPHAASVSPNTWSFALKSSDTPSGQPTTWTNMALHDAPSSHVPGSNCVSVLVLYYV
ncbi:unnamed protein product, partial [Meganyctiphanes norvegica]